MPEGDRPERPDRAPPASSPAPGAGGPAAGQEEVFAVPRADLEAEGLLPRGFAGGVSSRFLEVTAGKGRFIVRDDAEGDPSLKQVIPYAVVTFEDQVFLFERTGRGGEARLHRKLSIGVGGHINPEGVSPERLIEAGLRRELEEELSFAGRYRYRPIGLINDDDSAVGQVHIGIVFLVRAGSREVRVRETEILVGGFVPVRSLGPLLERMETWSRFVARGLYGKLL